MTFFGKATTHRHRGGAGTVSPQFTTAAPNGVGSITDTKGNAWALTTGTVSSNGKLVAQISVNGVVDPVTGSVYKLIYQGGRIWQFTAFGWYFKVLVADAWTFDPGPGSASGFIVNLGDNTAIIDVSAVVWQLTAGGQVKVDGVVDATTASVTQLEYFGAQIWQNTAFGWYKKTVPSDTWVFSATAPGVVGAGSTPTLLGAQLGDPGNGDSTIFTQFVAAMNEGPSVFTTYAVPDFGADWSNLQVWLDVANYSAHGINVMNGWAGAKPVTIPLVGIPMAQNYGSGADADFASIQAGNWDIRFTTIYDCYVSHGFTNIISRPGWEMNGDWEQWSVRPDNSNAAAFAATFRHIAQHAYNYASSHAGVTIKMCWNPGYVADAQSTPRPDFTLFYPGDAYVDHIGIDTYGTCSGVGDNGPLLTFPNNNYFGLDDAIKMCIAKGKPLCFPETGCSPGETTFQANVKTRMLQSPNCKVSFVAIWDQPTGCGPNALWSTNSASGAAWKDMFNAIRSTNGPW